MTQERFLRYLDNPSLLATISYEELKTLALIYPYAHNLRYLLALKAGQENHPDFDRNMATAAAYSLDRTRLFALLAPIKLAPQPVEQVEMVMELKPIETVQRELESKIPVSRKEEQIQQFETVQLSDFSESSPEKSDKDAIWNKQKLTQESAWQMHAEPEYDAPESEEIGGSGKVVPENLTTASFSEWMSRFRPPSLALEPKLRTKPIESESQKSEKSNSEEILGEVVVTPQKLAERSVTESRTIVSETLAKLYVQQGYRDKAIDMYERLCLAFPDKCPYFAAEIEKLKK